MVRSSLNCLLLPLSEFPKVWEQNRVVSFVLCLAAVLRVFCLRCCCLLLLYTQERIHGEKDTWNGRQRWVDKSNKKSILVMNVRSLWPAHLTQRKLSLKSFGILVVCFAALFYMKGCLL
ncbi:hypothetical protein QL285_023265 [Trifolium repens]|nr:hypothetical protein QL285_023265 [Trifolium repens]